MALYPVTFSIWTQSGRNCRLNFNGPNVNYRFTINFLRVSEHDGTQSVAMLYRNHPQTNLININQSSIEFKVFHAEGTSRSQIDCNIVNFEEFINFALQWEQDREDSDEEIIEVDGPQSPVPIPPPGGSPN
jgi:hypothetical protein